MRDFNVIIEFCSISFKGWQRVWLRETSYAQVTPQTSSTNFSQTHSNPGETKTMEGTTPGTRSVRFWSPKSSSFSGSDSIVVEEAAKNVGRV